MNNDVSIKSLFGKWEYSYDVEHVVEGSGEDFYDGYRISFPDFDTEDAYTVFAETWCAEPSDIETYAREFISLVIYSYITDGYDLPVAKHRGDHTIVITFRDFLDIKEADQIKTEGDDGWE